MRIGILGNGLMAAALGGQWAKAGHEVFVGGAITHPGVVLAVDAMAETISRSAEQARVVKAFNLAADSVWRRSPQPGQPLGVPICGDDRAALEQVAELVRDLGNEPVLAGGLERARLLEATAAFAIGVWVGGGDTRGLFPPKDQAF